MIINCNIKLHEKTINIFKWKIFSVIIDFCFQVFHNMIFIRIAIFLPLMSFFCSIINILKTKKRIQKCCTIIFLLYFSMFVLSK